MTFPHYLLQTIVGFTPNVHKFRRVSKRWNEALSNETIQMNDGLEYTEFSEFIGLRTKNLVIKNPTIYCIVPNLETLFVNTPRYNYDRYMLHQPLKYLKSLRIRASIYSIPILSHPECLKQLELSKIDSTVKNVIALSNFSHLESLELKFSSSRELNIDSLLRDCVQLKKLSLENVSVVDSKNDDGSITL